MRLLRLGRGSALLATVFVLTALAQTPVAPKTFMNPLLKSGPDPWVIYYKKFYYYMDTSGVDLVIRKTSDITKLQDAATKVVWTPPGGEMYSRELWAPELHRLDGQWYIYFAADDGENRNHRIFVVENAAEDPLEGSWIFKGEVNDNTNKWAIDPTVFEDRGRKYLVWSGWEGDVNGRQVLYIAGLKNPWTIDTPRVMISYPKYPWERVSQTPRGPHEQVDVNEAPEVLQHKNKVFVVYSASGCWTDSYELGLLKSKSDANLLDAHSWKKYRHPVFKENPKASVFGPGHNGFFVSPDGTQDWIIYHANPVSNGGCGSLRSPRIQRFTWKFTGTPKFGKPVPTGVPLAKPSGMPQ